jgi:hypothetical protein
MIAIIGKDYGINKGSRRGGAKQWTVRLASDALVTGTDRIPVASHSCLTLDFSGTHLSAIPGGPTNKFHLPDKT